MTPERQEFLDFTRRLIQIWKTHPVLRRRKFFQGRRIRGAEVLDIAWLDPAGVEMTDETWNSPDVRAPGRAPQRRRDPRSERARRADRRRHAAADAERRRPGDRVHPAARPRRIKLFSNNPSADRIAELTRSVETGDIRPVIDTIFPMADIAEAHRRLETGGVRGKYVIDMRRS